MATSCTFHGIIGISNADPYMMDNKNFWRYHAFIATPDSDLAVTVFAFRGNTASVEHGIYLIDARAVVGIILDEDGHSSQTIHLYVIDELQPLPRGSRALPTLIIAGKVSKGTFQLQQDRGFDIDVSQYAGTSSQNLRVRCYFPDSPRFNKTPFPPASKHVVVHATILRMEGDRCITAIKDIALGPLQGVVTGPISDSSPPMTLTHFDWNATSPQMKEGGAQTKEDSDHVTKDKGKKRLRSDDRNDAVG